MPEPDSLESRLFVAFDYPDIEMDKPRQLLPIVGTAGVNIKIGTTIAGSRGWAYPIERAHEYGARVFVDTKADDVPATVEDTSGYHIFPSFPFMVGIHASSGKESLEAFLERRAQIQRKELKKGLGSLAIAVTLLSHKRHEVEAEYNGRSPLEQVIYYADLAVDHGFNGIVCSGEELAVLNSKNKTKDLIKVVTGIRPIWAPQDDQERVMTPKKAIQLGATYLVVGRPVTKPPRKIGSSQNAIEKILEEMEAS